jgi:hypothetical protein
VDGILATAIHVTVRLSGSTSTSTTRSSVSEWCEITSTHNSLGIVACRGLFY